MLRSLLSCLGTRSQPDPLRAVDNQGERRGRFGRRRKTVGRVDEGDAGSVSKSTFGCSCFRKSREKVARSAHLDEDLCDGNSTSVISTEVLTEPDAETTSQRDERWRQRKLLLYDTCWIGHRLTVCSLQGPPSSSEAEQQPNQDLHVRYEQLYPEELLSPEPLEKIRPSQCIPTWIVSTEPDVCDREAKFAAARQKFRASSARFHQAVAEFDRRLVEPMLERSRSCVFPRSLEPSTSKGQDLDN